MIVSRHCEGRRHAAIQRPAIQRLRTLQWTELDGRAPAGLAMTGALQKAERSEGPWGIPALFGCAEERSARRIKGARLSERSEFRATPPGVSTAGCPGRRAGAQGRRQQGRLLLPSFLGETRKEGAPPGASPGTLPLPHHHHPEIGIWLPISPPSSQGPQGPRRSSACARCNGQHWIAAPLRGSQ